MTPEQGGAIGVLALHHAISGLKLMGLTPQIMVFSSIMWVFGTVFLILSMALTLYDWQLLFVKVIRFVSFTFQTLWRAVVFMARVRFLFAPSSDQADDPRAFDHDLEKKSPKSPEVKQENEPQKKRVKPASKGVKDKWDNKKLKVEPKPTLLGQKVPALSLLKAAPETFTKRDPIDLEHRARMLEGVLKDFGVYGEISEIRPGPVVTVYELLPAKGTKTSRIIGLSDDIARTMSAISVRCAVIPGRAVVGIEMPNDIREDVYLRDILESSEFQEATGDLNIVLGKDIEGKPVIADLTRMPHMLVAGTTGSGKSVGVNAIILSLLFRYTPDELRMIMIDPKVLELSVYENIPHLLTPVVTDPHKSVAALKWAVREMDQRYRQMAQLGVRNVANYNEKLRHAIESGETLKREVQTGFNSDTGEPIVEIQELDLEPFPYIVIIVDEFSDLMMVAGKDVELCVLRIAQKARAAGIHLIMATQRPSVDVVTGTIKANFPSRISYKVTSKIDSRTILGQQGADQLLGMGDMLYMSMSGNLMRAHGPFVSDDDVEKVVKYIRSTGRPAYMNDIFSEIEEGENDSRDPLFNSDSGEDNDLYEQALGIIRKHKKVSTSFIQRYLKIGYNRAARLVERMEEEGVISEANHAGKRTILIDLD